jgi:hypothetical protein
MSLLLLLAGLLCLLAGAGALAFCYLNPEFRHFDGLLAAGSVGVVGGLALVGLGAVAGTLRRITDMLEAQPAPRTLMTIGKAPAIPAATPELVAPVRDMPVEPAVAIPTPPAAPEPKIEPAEVREAPEVAVAPAPAAPEWPRVDASDRIGTQNGETSPEPLEAAANRSDTMVSFADPELRVLKSGVIEGMAYTLYSDGSVDAELPEGLKHFASISEWRAHLRETA